MSKRHARGSSVVPERYPLRGSRVVDAQEASKAASKKSSAVKRKNATKGGRKKATEKRAKYTSTEDDQPEHKADTTSQVSDTSSLTEIDDEDDTETVAGTDAADESLAKTLEAHDEMPMEDVISSMLVIDTGKADYPAKASYGPPAEPAGRAPQDDTHVSALPARIVPVNAPAREALEYICRLQLAFVGRALQAVIDRLPAESRKDFYPKLASVEEDIRRLRKMENIVDEIGVIGWDLDNAQFRSRMEATKSGMTRETCKQMWCAAERKARKNAEQILVALEHIAKRVERARWDYGLR